DRLYVKQYEEETNLRAQIVLDASRSMMYHSGESLTKFQYGSYLTAVLACLMARQQDAVGLTAFDQQIQLDMPCRTSARHFGEMMRQLESLAGNLESKADGVERQETHVADTLHRLAERFKRRCLIVLISDLYDDPDAVIRALHHFRHRRHDVMIFNVFDKAELEFPFRETMRFVDMETGEQLQVDPAFVREEYLQRIGRFIDGYRKSCNECQIDYVVTHTAVPYDFMLSRYLSKRSGL
ncbi:MAG: VWA domain-containing protein, partial [Pirellulaceae bacterium]